MKILKSIVLTIFLISVFAIFVLAQDHECPSGQVWDEAAGKCIEAKKKIVNAINNVYDLIKYIATAVGAVAIAYAGIMFMMSGEDPMKRNDAKKLLMSIIIGLILIWIAQPIVVALAGG